MEIPQAASDPQSTPPRRRFLAVCGKAAAALACLGVTLVAGRSVYPPLRRWVRLPRFVTPFRPIAAIESFPPGAWKLVPLASDAKEDAKSKKDKEYFWVNRDGDQPETFRVLSPICTHLGCTVKWKADRNLFVCPCHGGTFDADGNRKSGPPQDPLAVLDYRVRDGQLLVRSDL
jgi:nitrite reductase/ring-hydroxylating ferredoxin subunit